MEARETSSVANSGDADVLSPAEISDTPLFPKSGDMYETSSAMHYSRGSHPSLNIHACMPTPSCSSISSSEESDGPPYSRIRPIDELKGQILQHLQKGKERVRSRVGITMLQRAAIALEEYQTSVPKPYLAEDGSCLGDLMRFNCLFRQQMVGIAGFLAQLEEFRQLPLDQQWLLYRGIWHSMILIERFMAGFFEFGDEMHDKIVLANGSIHSFSTILDLFSCISHRPRHEIQRFFLPYVTQIQSIFIEPLIKMRPSFMECVYCILHTLWDVKDLEGITAETAHLASRIHLQLAGELSEFYVNDAGISNFASRFSKLMIIAAGLKKIDVQRQEDSVTSSTFDILSVDFFVTDLSAPLKNLSIS